MKLVLPVNDLNKARSVKYIRRWPKSSGKGWNYLYPEDFLHPFKFLKDVLGIQAKKIESDYEKNNISKDFGVDKKTFAAHALEYLTNRTTWDNFFTKKENRDKYKKPVRQSTLTKDKQEQKIGQENQPDLFKKEEKKESGKIVLNRSLMKRVWSIYNPTAKTVEQQDEKKPEVKPVELSDMDQDVRNSGHNQEPLQVSWSEAIHSSWNELEPGGQGKPSFVSKRPLGKNKIAMMTKRSNSKKDIAGLLEGVDDFVFRSEYAGSRELENFKKRFAALGFYCQKEHKNLRGESVAMLMIREGSKSGNVELKDEGKKQYSVITKDDNGNEIDRKTFEDIMLVSDTNDVSMYLYQKRKELNSPIKNEAEEHQNRSQAMLGNQNAKKFGMPEDVYTIMRNFMNELVNEKGIKNRQRLFDMLYKKNQYFRLKLDKYGGQGAEEVTGYNRTDIFNALYDDVVGGKDDNTRAERDGLSAGAENLRSGGSQGDSSTDVYGSAGGADGREFVQQPRDTGVGAGGSESEYRQSAGRLTKGQAKAIRQQCRELLDSKTNEQMTEADKELLRQYEGAGGLGEGNQTNAAVLSEFYTPRDVIAKVWELVDKYKPIKSKVLEPSSGIGRFAEGRSEKFTLCELDETSARIAEILHPEATVKQGAFQNLFMKNNAVQKNYTGEKYDVAVGNPPYGEYTGIYKGIGEGKIHTRYEEYFIDRTLDTLEDGGILAFVVPSGFLRGKTSKAKEAIAAKGKLMEAWRLPKGTFSSTDVGTDVIIVKKGKGDIKDFTDNRYFVENESHVIGHETDGGNWGTKIINLPEGKTVSEAIQMIDVSAVNVENDVKEAVKNIDATAEQKITKRFAIVGDIAVGAKIKTKDGREGEITGITQSGMIAYKVEGGGFGRLPVSDFDVFTDKKTEAELHQIRSEAMKGNQNAKKAFHKTREKKAAKGDVFTPSTGENMSADAFNKLYAKSIPEEDLKFWRATEWDGKINVAKLNEEEKAELAKNPRFINIDNSYISVANYASGNIYEKLEALEDEKNALSEDEYQKRKGILEKALPAKKSVENFTISPIANFAKTFSIDGDTLADKFLKYCRFNRNGNAMTDSPISEYDLDEHVTMRDIWDYIHQTPVRTERARRAEDKETEKMIAERKRQNRRDTTERLFNRWLRSLPKAETEAIEEAWNQRFNAFVNADFEQIPLYVEGMNTNKGSKKFVMTKQQIKGASELCNKGNGILAYDVGVGKALANSELVLTPNGWVKNGDLKVGDVVIGDDGMPVTVAKVFPQGVQDIYEVTFSDGATVKCTKEHLWDVQLPYMRNRAQARNKKAYKTLELQEFMNDLYNGRGERKYSIPMCKPVQFVKRDLHIKPYLMGVLLGDGCFKEHSVIVSIADEYIKDKIIGMLDGHTLHYTGKYDYSITGCKENRILPIIRNYGLGAKKSDQKFIPKDYLYSDVSDRIALLNGLFDTDGYVDARGTTVLYYTTSKQLAEDVKELVMSLGGTVSITGKQGTYKKNGIKIDCKHCYCMTVKLDNINPFSMPRKAERVVPKTKYKPVRYIDKVTLIGQEEATCIWVDNDSHLYLTNNYVVTHNTVTGIVATVSQVQTGQAKRPLICVPKAVYKKWIKEFKQHFPNEPINELGNFSEKDLGKFRDADGKVNLPERAVNICTYEALQKITFKPETLKGDLKDDIMDSQSIHDYDEWGNLVEDTRTDRERAKQQEDVMKLLGISAAAKEGAVYWEDLGIDHLTVDELHNFKNIFSIPRTFGKSQRLTKEKKRDIWGRVREEDKDKQVANEFSGIAGSTSSRGMKLFAISQLIQRENNGRGFFGLSATPFNNSPVEIYNILSLVARNRLKDLGIYNLQDFMLEFAEMKNDWKVKANGEVESAQVMKNFKNLGALQSLITEFIDKVDGEEAGVIRPYKRVHKPELDLTPLQKAIIKAETDRMNGAFRKSNEDNPADTLVAMNNMRMATLSPALIDPKFWGDYEEYEGWHAPKLQDIVKESPKLQFVCDTATQQYKARPTEGQVIYMPRGVEQYNYVKDYLVSQGIPADAVAFMDSSVSLDKKEQITSSFNDPEGKIKIIIGSETIKEGVSLNGNSTTIYNTMLGWNPTETIQVEGRIWRQGNKQGVTHVVYPLMNDSIDSMMYQKYDEKSSRLNALWSYKGDSLNVEDINPEELKFALIKDPEKRAKMRINQQQAELKRNLRMINAEYDNLGTMERELRTAKKGIEEWEGSVDTYSSAYSERKAEYQKAKEDLKAAEKALKKNPDDAELKTEEQRAKIVLSRMEFNLRNIEDALKGAKATLNSHKGTLERLDKQFTRMGVKPEASDAKLKELSAQREMIKQEIDSIEKQRDAYIEQARQDIAAEQAAQRHYTVQDRVDYYTAEIAGDLRPFAGVKSGIQQLRELGKTDIEQVISDIRQSGSARIGDDVFTAKDIRDLESYAKKAVKKSLVMANGRFYICG